MGGRRLSLDTARALNFAAHGRTVWGGSNLGWRKGPGLDYRPGVLLRYAGRSVTMARPRVPYAISVDGRSGGILHETRAVFVAWYHGRPVGMLVALWCGGRLTGAELTGDETRGTRRCLMCGARRETLGQVCR